MLPEVEEEELPYVNNGLPLIKRFSEVTRASSECDNLFFLAQVASTATGPNLIKYKVDLLVNHTAIFYNRVLFSRATTFFHQATVNKV